MSLGALWQLLAGLGMFLYGMFQQEDSLKQLAGRTFKLFLRKHTENKVSAILSGALVTGILQSSSVVSLMVLSFVGAGVISMLNALSVVFGSNLGSTLANWIVVTIGFKFEIENISLPFIAISGIGLILFPNVKKVYLILKFCMGFGLLFLGLGFMKGSIEALVQNFDYTPFVHLNKLSFIFIGFIITAVIQSSSALMVITLSALNIHAIPFETAVSIVIGAEVGSNIKVFLGSICGTISKKRVAYGNMIFNLVMALFAYIFMYPIIELIKLIIGVNEPLIGLVLVQTIINLFGIILFFPFLKQFGHFLEKHIKERRNVSTYFVKDLDPLVPNSILKVLEKETLLFIHRVINLNMEAFRIDGIPTSNEKYLNTIIKQNNKLYNSYSEKYDNVKHAEGEILSLYTKIIEEKINQKEIIRLKQLVASVRNAMYSAKGLKNIDHDRKDLQDSVIDIKFEQYEFLQTQLHDFYLKLNNLLNHKEKSSNFDELVKLMEEIQKDYENRMHNIYSQSANNTLENFDISTLLNVNREIYSSCKAMIFSLKNYLFTADQVENFDKLPISFIK